MKFDSKPVVRTTMMQLLFVLFLKLVAALCFIAGLRYWDMIIGYSSGGAVRFDLLSGHWQIATALLAFFYPFAALGLWSGASWGVVIWVAVAGSEVLMHTVGSNLFGTQDVFVQVHFAVAACYLIFKIIMLVDWYRHRNSVRNDSP